MIPAAALMSTHCLHLSVVRLDLASLNLAICGCKTNDYFCFGNKSAANLFQISIFYLVLLHLPGAEGFEGLVAEQRDERHGAFFDMLFQFLVNEVIGEVDGGGILFRVAVIDALDMRPIDGAEAHRAGLAGGIDDTVREVEGAQFATGLADGVHFGMGGGVVVAGDAVRAASDDFAISHDDGPEGTATVFHTLVGEADGFAHKGFILFGDFHSL